MLHDVVVAAAIVMLHVVLQLLLLCCIWCCGCCDCATHGVVGTVIRLHYVMVMVAMPHVVSWSLLLHCVVLSSWLQLSCHMWCCGHGRCTMWCYGHGGCRCATWCHSCGYYRSGIVVMVGGCTVVGPRGGGLMKCSEVNARI